RLTRRALSHVLLSFSFRNDYPITPLKRLDSRLRDRPEPPNSFNFMIHHVVLYKLKSEVTPARVEEMMMNARMQLLKIPEVLSIKCGKRVDPALPWPFFI